MQHRIRCTVMALALAVVMALPISSFAQETRPRGADTSFWLVSGGLIGSMTLDTRSTYQAFSRCPTCREANPFAKPFVDAGPPFAYTAGAVLDVGVLAAALRMKNSNHPVLRKIWWVAPVAMTIGHALAIRNNMHQR